MVLREPLINMSCSVAKCRMSSFTPTFLSLPTCFALTLRSHPAREGCAAKSGTLRSRYMYSVVIVFFLKAGDRSPVASLRTICCYSPPLSMCWLEPLLHHLTIFAHVAVQVGVFRLLAEKHGAQLDTLTTNQSGLLHVACEAGALDVAKLLLEEHG